MSSGGCVWKASGSGFRADESIGSKQGISGRHRPTFLTAGGLWGGGVAFSAFLPPPPGDNQDNQLRPTTNANERLHPPPKSLPLLLLGEEPANSTLGR